MDIKFKVNEYTLWAVVILYYIILTNRIRRYA